MCGPIVPRIVHVGKSHAQSNHFRDVMYMQAGPPLSDLQYEQSGYGRPRDINIDYILRRLALARSVGLRWAQGGSNDSAIMRLAWRLWHHEVEAPWGDS